STVSAETMREVQDLAAQKGVDVIDAPLCRGEPAAEAGKLLVLVGGDAAVVERCQPVLSAFGSDVFRVGGLGSGQIGKMINNLLLWACVSANWEGLRLAEALGVDPEKLRQALLLSSGNNWALETWLLPRPMPWAEKDMAIVMEQADKARLSLPLCGVTREVIKGIKIERGLPPPPRR
ncbi:MAG TPA: NAD(P)-dependent oxidoreductase, partial [Beijerinckiaceae bacterium]|nr:NAD(P)-dependent oxidoreductase [Beijerinckiaceae bacterium]